jgi:hypothetical protein
MKLGHSENLARVVVRAERLEKSWARNLAGIAACVALLSPASTATAVSISFDLNFEFSGATEPAGPSPWVRVTFDDATGDPNSVQLTIDALGLTPDSPGESLESLYLNFDPLLDPTDLTFVPIDVIASTPTAINLSIDTFQADGDGLFDIDIEFPPPTGQGPERFTAGEVVIFEIIHISPIDALSFDFESVMGGGSGSYSAAAHILSIGPTGADSGWIGPVQVPEATTGVMLGLGLLLGSLVHRKS